MPIQDHFHSPLNQRCPWSSLLGAWTVALAFQLNRDVLPEQYRALPRMHFGSVAQLDVAAIEDVEDAGQEPASSTENGSLATAVWAPPKADLRLETDLGFPDGPALDWRRTADPH